MEGQHPGDPPPPAEASPVAEGDRFHELLNEILMLRHRIDLMESSIFARMGEMDEKVDEALEGYSTISRESFMGMEESLGGRLRGLLDRVEGILDQITSHVDDSVRVTDESIRLLSTRVAKRLQEIRDNMGRQESEYRDMLTRSVEDIQSMVEEFFARLEERMEGQIGEVIRNLEEQVEEIRQLYSVYSDHLDKKYDALSEVQVLQVERVEALQGAMEAMVKSHSLVVNKTTAAEKASRETLNYLGILRGIASSYEERLSRLEQQVQDLLMDQAELD